MTPQQMANVLSISVNSVKTILKENRPDDNWQVTNARYKCSTISALHWSAPDFREELRVAISVQDLDLIELIACMMSDMERIEPYNCKWGYIRQRYLGKWVKVLKTQGEYVGLNRPPKHWVECYKNNPSGSKQPKGYIPYDIINGSSAYWGYRYDMEDDALYYSYVLIRESDVGHSANNLEGEIKESLGHYQRLIDEQTDRGSASRMAWVKLQSLATHNLHAYNDLRDTWRGWHSGKGMAIQWRV